MKQVTIHNLDQVTEQEVFDFVVNHLRTQGVKAQTGRLHGYPVCRYKTGDGLKCAAGCLIPDESYDPNIEKRSWSNVTGLKHWSDTHSGLISSLQTIHDTFEVNKWESEFEDLAQNRGLTFTPKQ